MITYSTITGKPINRVRSLYRRALARTEDRFLFPALRGVDQALGTTYHKSIGVHPADINKPKVLVINDQGANLEDGTTYSRLGNYELATKLGKPTVRR